MKKALAYIVGISAIILVVLFFGGHILLKNGIETVGSKVLGAKVTMGAINISPWNGKGKLYDFSIANPEGFEQGNAFAVKELTFNVDMASVFTPKLVVKSIVIDGPELNVEGSLTSSNFTKLKENAEIFGRAEKANESADNTSKTEVTAKAGRTVVVQDLLIKNGQVGVKFAGVAQAQFDTRLGYIHLTNLGGKSGVKPAKIVEEIMGRILGGVSQISVNLSKDLNQERIKEGVQSIKDKFSGIFK